MPNLFLSYRRVDSADATGRLYDRLVGEFGRDSIFKDVDTIPPGVPFPDHIRGWIAKTDVFLAVIGPQWVSCTDLNGRRRLEDPTDLVRIEIETALTRDLLVVPVITGGAKPPTSEDLPGDTLPQLAILNAAFARPDPDFHADVTKLLSKITPILTSSVGGNGTPGGVSRDGGRPDGSDLPPDEVQLLLYAFINQSNILIIDDYPDMRCVYTRGQYFGFEYCPQYIRDCADDDRPKQNPPGARVERLRWLTVLEAMEQRGLVQAVSKNNRKEVYSLTSYGRRRANEIIQWRREHSPGDVPVPSMF
jgi:hypothetical protein